MIQNEDYDLLDLELRCWLGVYFWGRAMDVAPRDDRQFHSFACYITDIAASLRARGQSVAAVMSAVTDPRTEAAARAAATRRDP